MADAFGVAEIDGFADVEAEAVGRDEAGGEFAGVEADVDRGIDAVEIVEHEHLAVVLGHGHVGVFGLDEVEADDAGVLRGDFKGEEGLGEDLLRREGAEDLVEEADFDGAGGRALGWPQFSILLRASRASSSSLRSTATSSRRPAARRVSRRWLRSSRVVPVASPVRFWAGSAGVVGQSMWEPSLATSVKMGVSMISRYCSFCAAARVATSSSHSPVWDLSMPPKRPKVAKNWSCPLMPALGTKAAHGEGVDEGVVELLVFEGVLGADVAFATDGLRRNAAGGGSGFEEAHAWWD